MPKPVSSPSCLEVFAITTITVMVKLSAIEDVDPTHLFHNDDDAAKTG
jgi:hypothetical protein